MFEIGLFTKNLRASKFSLVGMRFLYTLKVPSENNLKRTNGWREEHAART